MFMETGKYFFPDAILKLIFKKEAFTLKLPLVSALIAVLILENIFKDTDSFSKCKEKFDNSVRRRGKVQKSSRFLIYWTID